MTPRWLRFSLKSLLLAITVFALALTVPRHKSLSQHHAANQLQRHGVQLRLQDRPERQPFWQRLLFGDDTYDFVDAIRVEEVSLSNSDIAHLSLFPGVVMCVFNKCATADAALAAVGRMESLEHLHVNEAQLTSEGLSHLRKLPKLRVLRLGNTPMKEVDLSAFKTLPLQSLLLAGKNVDDSFLVQMAANCSDIRSLILSNTGLTDDGLAPLANLKDLKGISLLESNVSGDGLRYLVDLPELTHLSLLGSAIDDTGLRQIERIRTLRTLRLDSTLVTDEGIAALKRSLPDCKVRGGYKILETEKGESGREEGDKSARN